MRQFGIILLLCSFFLLSSGDEPVQKYWVFFKAKDTALLNKVNNDGLYRKTLLSERSIKRRQKIFGAETIRETDLPVSAENLKYLSALGYKPIVVSKWLNAASFYLTDSQVKNLIKENFIKDIRRVAGYKRPDDRIESAPENIDINTLRKDIPQTYGQTYFNNELVNIIDLHVAGITGEGVLVGVLDNGFNRNHEALENVEIIAEYDFINQDTITVDEPGQDFGDQDGHGTSTLSVIGGYKEGKLIGAAYGAEFALAKTEDESGETSIEEDYWVAGLEWLDSVGVDIVSSSLGYSEFTDVAYYSTSDMDGKTAVTTIAADIAAQKGILVVNSAGNEANDSWKIITAPADGFNVLTVGAVWIDGMISSFSSTGPTADGRVKPDVVAQGVGVYTAVSGNYSGYASKSGTSFSCPTVAGAAALILSAHPDLTSFQIMDALKQTADRNDSPNNLYGWGLIDTYAAASYFGPVFSNKPEVTIISGGSLITTSIISKYGIDEASMYMHYAVGELGSFSDIPLQPAGEENEYSAVLPEIPLGELIKIYFSAEDLNGRTTLFPGTTNETSFKLISGETGITRDPDIRRPIPDKFELLQNYPNPFNYKTTIRVKISETTDLKLYIYNSMGQKVKTLFNNSVEPSFYTFQWDGTDDLGRAASSGLYICLMRTGSFSKAVRMIYIK
ncbi:S8 family serine peptidase [candidate division KSB1 bacterium]